ncbi:MAG: DNA-3-methyladenine glycosylase [Tunicatimonas sp.]
MNVLPKSFYQRSDVVQISREFLGKYLFADIDGELAGGKIVETEAYAHVGDQACHSHLNRRTTRTEVMFRPGGVAYVYKVYGFHYLFNMITNVVDKADAVLVRAIEPTLGWETMQRRRSLTGVVPRLTAGPGMLTQALGITKQHYGLPLTTGETIWIEDRGETVADEDVLASPRVGIDYAGEDALLPWRFRVKGSKWTSKAK